MFKYDYVVAFYLGERRNKLYQDLPYTDKYLLVEKHLEFISNTLKNSKVLNKVYFIVNENEVENFLPIYKDIYSLIKKYELEDLVDCDIKPNSGFSYGAWEHVLLKNIKRSVPEYAFLCEDDYIPTIEDFHTPFYNQLKGKNTGFVATLYWPKYKPPHAAISNGFIKYDTCKLIHTRYSRIFDINSNRTVGYGEGVDNQVTFLNLITATGFDVLDISEECSIPFLEVGNISGKPSIKYYGNSDGKVVVEPITDLKNIEISLLTEKDLEFLCEVRNECAPEYLHTSETYTLAQTKEWFKKTSPQFYLITRRGEKVGYFRTSNYSKDNKNIYIGADLHKDYRGKGLAYAAYMQFIPHLFEKLDLHKISLEVLATNNRAINLYKKVGFKEEGTKREEILKKDQWVDSIIMSILKPEWKL